MIDLIRIYRTFTRQRVHQSPSEVRYGPGPIPMETVSHDRLQVRLSVDHDWQDVAIVEGPKPETDLTKRSERHRSPELTAFVANLQKDMQGNMPLLDAVRICADRMQVEYWEAKDNADCHTLRLAGGKITDTEDYWPVTNHAQCNHILDRYKFGISFNSDTKAWTVAAYSYAGTPILARVNENRNIAVVHCLAALSDGAAQEIRNAFDSN